MSTPIAVVISDIHFNIKNLDLAAKALKIAVSKAESLNVPLIIAGDLNDTKAIIRAEVINVLCPIIFHAEVRVYAMVGNHDLCNERGTEHSLNFLRPYATVIDAPYRFPATNLFLIPYQSDPSQLNDILSQYKGKDIVVMHQGFKGAQMGDYVLDKSAIDIAAVKDLTVISGHYHNHQTIGTVTYIGSPYTMTFGEAKDSAKGFLILNSDSSYERVLTNLRKHIKMEVHVDELNSMSFKDVHEEDLFWLVVNGPSLDLAKINKDELFKHPNFKLELNPTDLNRSEQIITRSENLTDGEYFDILIDESDHSPDNKQALKDLWKELI